MKKLCARQVHLDFHTSEHITGIGSRFSRRQFQQALKVGNVNSITVFAKCHHGWSYYPTQIGSPHPHLKINLLKEQIEACHAIGVRAPIYYTLGWSANDVKDHPDWAVRRRDGSLEAWSIDPKAKPTDKRPGCSWTFLCPSGGYRNLVVSQTEEICRLFPVDGFFYDICTLPTCWCENCRTGMQAEGLDPNKEADAQAYKVKTWRRLMNDCREVILSHHPDATLFFNGTANTYGTDYHPWDTHFELEDLPTAWGGYNKFPARAKLYAQRGKDYMAMSGKFHTSWGEFGGFKHPDAIRYEAASMIAWGARCSFGDQAHPCGEMDMATYRNIGEAYSYVKRIEPYGLDGQSAASLGLWLCGRDPDDQGIINMLLEGQVDFDIVEPEADLQRFETIVLTGGPCLTKDTAAKLAGFVRQGGSLVVVGEGALDSERKRFLIDVGATYIGPATFENDYLVVKPPVTTGLVTSPFLNYSGALRTRVKKGARILAAIREPYFNRTYEKYCSHLNTPYQLRDAAHPGVVKHGRVVFFAHKLGAMYHDVGARLHRDLFLNGLRLVHQRPVLSTSMPSCGRANLIHQPDRNRYVAHLLYAPALQRGRCQIIEDLVPLHSVPVTLDVPEAIRRASLAPAGQELKMVRRAGRISVTVPSVECHQMVVFEY